MKDTYETPLSSRYASDYMLKLFSSDTRYQTWRKLWVALAKAESALGLPVTEAQVKELQGKLIQLTTVNTIPAEHDVMLDIGNTLINGGKIK